MKSSDRLGGFPHRLRGHLREALFFAFAVARSPQEHIDIAWATSRKYLFSVIFISLVLSKCFHIFVHLKSLTLLSLLWSPTFFLVDIILILVACGLTRSFVWRTTRDIAAVVAVLFSLGISGMTAANISFYVQTGLDIYWRRSKTFHKDVSAKTVLGGLFVAFLVEGLIMVGAYFATPYLYRATDALLQIWASVFSAAFSRCRRKKPLPDPEVYEEIAIDDYEDSDSDSVALLDTPRVPPVQTTHSLLKRAIVVLCSSVVILLSLVRPQDTAYRYLSESLPFAPFGGPKYRPAHVTAATLPGYFPLLKDHSALDHFPKFDWLPVDESTGKFPDWSPFRYLDFNRTILESKYAHYNPSKDPLHIPNLQNNILEPLRDALHNGSVKIKHVILVKLESTRQDIWPFRSDSFMMDLIDKSYNNDSIPEDVMARLSNLTPTAERLTGFETGFRKGEEHPKPYGGISASKAYTSGTYTLKSITGTVCGANPMAVENQLEYMHDIYQPCLPQIFEALNHQPNTTAEGDDWTSWPWHTMWMQSHYGTWDKQERLTPHLGYKDIMTRESINDNGRKYIPEENEEETHHGHEDKVLRNYIRDLFADAKKNNTRLFLSHLTHNTHTPYFIPGEYEEMMGDADSGLNQKISRHLNTMHYQDQWIAEILEVLEEAGVADETLLIMAGDHGLSLPNDGGITAWHDPHVASFHVPLFFSHPKMPQIEVDSPVLSTQILPTLLDLLIETGSMDEQSTKILNDLLPLYEGQSMLRPLITEQDGKQEWHFSTMNPGGTWVSMRSAAQPYRLVVPLVADAPWRFTNVVEDPFELSPQEDLDVVTLVDVVQNTAGVAAAKWLNEAAHVAQWWILENRRRWKYDPENPESPNGLII